MLVNRVGTFLILIGAAFLGLFILSELADALVCNFFWYGLVFLVVGILLWFRNPPQPAQPTGRFRVLRIFGKKQVKKK